MSSNKLCSESLGDKLGNGRSSSFRNPENWEDYSSKVNLGKLERRAGADQKRAEGGSGNWVSRYPMIYDTMAVACHELGSGRSDVVTRT